MKQFKDLVFNPHPIAIECGIKNYENAKQAVMYFNNGYGVSVVFGSCFYSNGIDTYELAILRDADICYDTEITNDVIGYLTSDEVSKIMKQVQEL